MIRGDTYQENLEFYYFFLCNFKTEFAKVFEEELVEEDTKQLEGSVEIIKSDIERMIKK